MALLPTPINFEAGEPLPSTKFNGLVGASAELSEAFAGEHRADGRHVGLRFECALASIEWVPGSPGRWLPYGLQRGLAAQSVIPAQPAGENDLIFTITDPDLLALPNDRLGVLAYDQNSLAIPVKSITGSEIRLYEARRGTVAFGTQNLVSVIAFGLR